MMCIKDKITVKSYVYPSGLKVTSNKTTLVSSKTKPGTAKIKTTLKTGSIKKYKFKENNKSLATVDSDGIITANKKNKAGTVTVTVSSVMKTKKNKTLSTNIKFKIEKEKVTDNLSKNLKLNDNGTLTGAFNGTWEVSENNITLVEYKNNQIVDTYKGKVIEQYEDDGDNFEASSVNKTMVFTALGKKGTTIWGSKVSATSKECVEFDASQITVPEKVSDNFTLLTKGLKGTEISWKSSNENLISVDNGNATVNKQLVEEEVALTAIVSKDGETTEKTFNVKVAELVIDVPGIVNGNRIELPTTIGGQSILWSTSDESVISVDGNVTEPETTPVTIILTATIGNIVKTFDVVTNLVYHYKVGGLFFRQG